MARSILSPLNRENYRSSFTASDDTMNSDIIFVKNGHPVITKVEKSASVKRG